MYLSSISSYMSIVSLSLCIYLGALIWSWACKEKKNFYFTREIAIFINHVNALNLTLLRCLHLSNWKCSLLNTCRVIVLLTPTPVLIFYQYIYMNLFVSVWSCPIVSFDPVIDCDLGSDAASTGPAQLCQPLIKSKTQSLQSLKPNITISHHGADTEFKMIE